MRNYCPICGSEDLFTFGNIKLEIDIFQSRGVMCDCCYFEFDFDIHDTNSFMRERDVWINLGMPYGSKLRPDDMAWTLSSILNQLQNLKKIDPVHWPESVKKRNKNWSTDIDIKKIEFYYYKKRADLK